MDKMKGFKNRLSQKRAVKVITGINNFDIENIKKVIVAAEQGNASAVDVAARENIIYIAKELTDLPVFVSSIIPEELAMAAEKGADALEIGNFDALYAQGLKISAQDVLEITKKTVELVGNDIFLSVTIPGNIDINEQISLAKELELLGVDLIQSEGAPIASTDSNELTLTHKAHISITNTMELVKNTKIPVMTASGITPTTAGLSFAAGASAVGVGSCINKLNSVLEMTKSVRAVVAAANCCSCREELTTCN